MAIIKKRINCHGKIQLTHLSMDEYVLISHFLPALLVDMILRINGKKPMLFKLQRKIFTTSIFLQRFMTYEWDFDVNNFIKLRSCLKEDDMQEFYYDFKNYFSKQYVKNFITGTKKFLLEENDENTPKIKLRMKRVYLADKVIRYIIYGVAVWVLITSQFAINLYENIIKKE